LTEVIYAHGGTVDKYMGDCVMAFWGAPMACEDHADRATHAAMAIQERVKTLNAARRIEGRPPIRVCIGVNTGVMAVGDMGSNLRRSYTVIGDAVNLASRIESLTRVYGFNIVAGERTTVLSFEFLWQHVDRVQVKGRAQLEDIYTPISLMTRASADLVAEIDAWNEALAAYLNGNSSQLQAFLMKFGNSSEQKSLYQMFADRLTSPQPDGVVAAPSAAPLLPPPP
jgi:adenylate cyclase